MRRVATVILATTLLLESSGSALATSAGGSGSPPNLWSVLTPVIAAIQGTRIVAEITGKGDVYAASHEPMPRLARPIPVGPAPEPNVSTKRLAKMYFRTGVRKSIVLPKAPPLERVPDPLAMSSNGRSLTASTAQHPRLTRTQSSGVLPTAPGHLSGSARSLGSSAATTPRPIIGRQLLATPSPTAAPLGQAGTDTGTGINRYWEYEERAIPGVGKAMVNVGTGNLVVQATDVNIPERGLGLVFQRTYNSQSLHDANGDDGSEPAIFGNGWTNTFDAHLVFQPSGVISVYDIDGTRCDYTANSGSWTPCTGEYGKLKKDPTNVCAYWWIKKNGTAYYFYSDSQNPKCTAGSGNIGRLYEIVGRNSNNNITLNYSWQVNKPETSQYITEIDVNHSDGHSLIMKFANAGGSGPNELAMLKYPDPSLPSQNVIVQYSYDTSGDLQEVDRPGNNQAAVNSSILNANGVPTGDLPETYGIQHPMQYVCSPRATISKWNHSGNGTDGSCLNITYDGSGNVQKWQVNGVLNFAPLDGLSTPLIPGGLTDWEGWYVANFSYGTSNPACTHETAGTTTMCDTDGHSTMWTINSAYQVIQRNEYTGEASPTNLVTTQHWDPTTFNLLATTDPVGNETDYLYDGTGNTIAVALPPVNDTQNGSGYRATSLYSYDSSNNLVAYCDPRFTHHINKDWASGLSQSDNLCPTSTGGSWSANVYVYDYSDSNEPFGKLTTTYSPMGYSYTISYNTAQGGGGDFGLPTQVQGEQISQSFDDEFSTRQPTKQFTYDQYGNLTAYSDSGSGSWALYYDADNREVSRTDPDGVPSVSCSYLDGTSFYSEQGAQHHYDGGGSVSNGIALCPDQVTASALLPPAYAVSYSDDADGDAITQTHHFMQGPDLVSPAVPAGFAAQSPGVTQKFYDGLDRLVEVQQPQDPNADVFGWAWTTRYIYDLNLSGSAPDTVTIDGNPVKAYGGLYETQECLPGSEPVTIGSSKNQGTCSLQNVRGNAFDGLDRPTQKFENDFGTTAELTNHYDSDPTTYGLLAKSINANTPSQYTAYTYDAAGRVTEKSYDSTTPTKDYTYDADGRVASITQSPFGEEDYSYYYDGWLKQKTEPSGGIAYGNSHAVIGYEYYGDGKRSALDLTITPTPVYGSASFNGNQVIQYAYSNQGLLHHERVNLQSAFDYLWEYTPAGRELTQKDPSYNATILTYNSSGVQNGSVTVGTKTYVYDSYGRVKTLAFPTGRTMAGFTYDAEGETVNDWGPNQPLTLPPAPQNVYSTRGELVWSPQPFISAFGGQSGWKTATEPNPAAANGTVCITSCGANIKSGESAWQSAASSAYSPSYSYTYDPSGRNNQTTVTCKWQGGIQDQGTLTKNYDSENHVISTTMATENANVANNGVGNPADCTVVSPDATLNWGNSGHPYVAVVPPVDQTPGGTTSYHWDGDSLLYSAWGSGTSQNVSLYLGTIGEATIGLNGATAAQDVATNDRDYAGQQYQTHNSTVFTTFGYQGARIELHSYKTGTVQLGPPSWGGNAPANLPPAISARKDGYQIAGLTIQGVRAFDPTNAQWTSPDAFSGDATDPMSQKPFVWNNNNSIAYEDPSGYCSDPGGSGDRACVDQFIPSATSLTLRGDNRGFTGSDRNATARVHVTLDFQDHDRSNIQVSASHYPDGSSAGAGQAISTSISWNGNTASVHIEAACGICPPGGPLTIRADYSVTDDDGKMTITGTRSQYPAFEAYGYTSGGGTQTLTQDQASQFGAFGLLLPDTDIAPVKKSAP